MLLQIKNKDENQFGWLEGWSSELRTPAGLSICITSSSLSAPPPPPAVTVGDSSLITYGGRLATSEEWSARGTNSAGRLARGVSRGTLNLVIISLATSSRKDRSHSGCSGQTLQMNMLTPSSKFLAQTYSNSAEDWYSDNATVLVVASSSGTPTTFLSVSLARACNWENSIKASSRYFENSSLGWATSA